MIQTTDAVQQPKQSPTAKETGTIPLQKTTEAKSGTDYTFTPQTLGSLSTSPKGKVSYDNVDNKVSNVNVPGIAVKPLDGILSPANVLFQVRRHNGTEPFSSIATVAAGGNDSDEHRADVRVCIKPGFAPSNSSSPTSSSETGSLAGIPIPFKVKILHGEGVAGKDAIFIPAENPVTDSSGCALLGTFKSSDKNTMGEPLVHLELDMGWGEDNPRVFIEQSWATSTWRLGEHGEHPWDPSSFPYTGDYTIWIWVKMTGIDGKPLRGHTMKLVVDLAKISDTDPVTEKPVTTTFTTDPDETGPDEAGGNVVYRQDLTEILSQYFGLPELLHEDDPGVYKGLITVRNDVQSYTLGIQDQHVYVHK